LDPKGTVTGPVCTHPSGLHTKNTFTLANFEVSSAQNTRNGVVNAPLTQIELYDRHQDGHDKGFKSMSVACKGLGF
jgi:hypothetical protein